MTSCIEPQPRTCPIYAQTLSRSAMPGPVPDNPNKGEVSNTITVRQICMHKEQIPLSSFLAHTPARQL
jgi:hypothetical protein